MLAWAPTRRPSRKQKLSRLADMLRALLGIRVSQQLLLVEARLAEVGAVSDEALAAADEAKTQARHEAFVTFFSFANRSTLGTPTRPVYSKDASASTAA